MGIVGKKAGNQSTIPGRPSAARLLQHMNVVDQMIKEKETALRRLTIVERGTPVEDVTPIFEAKKKAIEMEILRLKAARAYWKRILDEELTRLKARGAREEDLPDYEYPPLRSQNPTPEELGIYRPEPYYDPFPIPREKKPDDKACKIPAKLTGKEREAFILWQWTDYWKELQRAREDYDRELDRWYVEKYFWEERKRKTLIKGKPFAESPPEKPKMRSVDPPHCPPPATDVEI